MRKFHFYFCVLLQILVLCFISAHSNAQTLKYTYDALGRVVTVEDSVNGNRSFEYDPAGNRTKVQTSVKPPIITPNGGTFGAAQQVSMKSATPDALIYYTTDGSTPTKSSKLYSAPFSVNVSSTVKAIAVKADMKDSTVSTAPFSITLVLPPTIDPNGGTFSTGPVSVKLTPVTPGSTIYYTTNNLPPTTSSASYSVPFNLSGNATVRAIAVKNGMTTSSEASAQFNIAASAVATPSISPNGGTFSGSSQTVTLSTTTSDAAIYYTTNDSTPSAASSRYTAPITLTKNAKLRVMAVKDGMTNSSEAIAQFSFRLPAPTVSPDGGKWFSPRSVTLTSGVTDAVIYYTTDNSTPTAGVNPYTGTLSLTGNTTIRAIAVKSEMTTSAEASATFTVIPPLDAPTGLKSLHVADCAWTASWNSVPGADSYYLVDSLGNSSTTTATSINVVCPVGNPDAQKPKSVKACNSGLCGAETQFNVPLQRAATPVITPNGNTFSTSQTVTLSTGTSEATIYYTLNNTAPTRSSNVYTGPFNITSDTIVRAIAGKSDMLNSTEVSASFTRAQVVPAPSISPNGGGWTSPLYVTLTSTVSGASIYYTTNNTAPTTSSALYTANFPLTANTTIRAIAVKSGMTTSVESSASFVIVPAIDVPTGLKSQYVASCAWSASWNPVSGADSYYFSDSQGSGSFTTATSKSVDCPIGNPEGRKPSSVKACNAGICGSPALFSASTLPATAPSISPGSSNFSNPFTVTLTPGTSGSTIYYTTNGSTPTTLSNLYTGPFTVSSASTIVVKAIAVNRDMWNSTETSATYTYVYVDTQNPSAPGTPSFSNVTTSGATVSWSAATDNIGVTGYEYSVSGSPWSSAGLSTSLSGLSAGTAYTVSVRARDAAGNYGGTSSASFTTMGIVASPSFNPGDTSYSGTLVVNMFTATAGATIYYTTDGSTPTTSSSSGSSVSFSNRTAIIKAIAAKSGMATSGVSGAIYTYIDNQSPTAPGTPSFNSIGGTSANATWSASTDNVGVASYEYSLYAGSTFIRSANVGSSQNVILTGLSETTGYTFYVRAIDTSGNSSTWSGASFTTPASPLPAPSNARKNNPYPCTWRGDWDSVPGADSYLFADTQGRETSVSVNFYQFTPCSSGETLDSRKPKWVKACKSGSCGFKADF